MRYLGSVLAALAWTAAAASAQPAAARPARLALIPASTAIQTLRSAAAPIGWIDFCARYAGECDVDSLPAQDMTLDRKAWALLNTINKAVNGEIEPITDEEHWRTVERWDYPSDGKGDCEDFVLEKRRRLIAAGAPRQALLISVVRDKKGDGHAVLLVKTDHGDYVLDNQDERILPWSETGYGFVKRQSQQNPNRWVSLDEARPGVVAVGKPR